MEGHVARVEWQGSQVTHQPLKSWCLTGETKLPYLRTEPKICNEIDGIDDIRDQPKGDTPDTSLYRRVLRADGSLFRHHQRPSDVQLPRDHPWEFLHPSRNPRSSFAVA